MKTIDLSLTKEEARTVLDALRPGPSADGWHGPGYELEANEWRKVYAKIARKVDEAG